MGGFDTHVNQTNRHNRLLKTYSESIEVLVNDLNKTDTFKDILTFSRFARRVQQNAGGVTDYGAANNLFLIWQNLKKKGFYNDAPNLLKLDDNGDLIHTVDYRSVYVTISDK